MNIEEEVFKRCKILYDKLIPFGFTKKNNIYEIEKYILDKTQPLKMNIQTLELVIRKDHLLVKLEKSLQIFLKK